MGRKNKPDADASATPVAADEGPLASGERLRPWALAGLTVVLVALCILLAVPFLPAIAWGVALAVIAWPMHAWVRRRLVENESGAAALSTAVVVLILVVPGVFVARQLAREAAAAADRQNETTIRDRLAAAPGMGEVVAWVDRTGVDLDAEVRKAIQSFVGDGAALAQGSVMATLQALVALFILYYILRDRRELLAGVRRVLPLRRSEADRVFESAAGSVYANLYATLVTSVIDGVGGGLMFWAVGLPSPVTWGVVIFVLSFLPILGTYIVWLPAAIYLAIIDNWAGAVAILAWGVVFWLVVDNIVHVRIAAGRMRLHQIPTLIAFLGGLAVFGASGLILGPAILAVTVAVLEVWHLRAAESEAAGSEPATAPAKPQLGGMSVAPLTHP
jgi:predicted PurR-regulated permease PerM